MGLAIVVGAPSTLAASWGSVPRAQVIVMAAPGATASIERAVLRVGGEVEQRLSIIGGFSAAVPADVVPTLRGLPGVVSVSADSEMQPQDATYDPATDVNSMNAVTRYTGAVDWWNTGYTGAGVDVAVIDTGVSPVEGLATPGKVLNGPDLSIESQAPNLRYLDTFGHGTFMAGLIAGHDSALTVPYADAPASSYRGMAPDARIVSVKVGTADGGTDVSQVIAAIDWVVQHAQDPGLNIRVLNLSYGTNSTQSYTLDPLAFAAEQAWKHGIVVVAAGGNSGFQRHLNNAPALANPAFDPFLLAVGASDSQGTDTLADDLVPAFSPWVNRGATRGVDLVAPGTHLQGLRVPNSYIDANHPEGLLGDRYFRGSGTSQAAAIMSGAAALVLQKYPSATPESGEAAAHLHRVSDQREVSGHRRRRAPALGRPDRAAPDVHAVVGPLDGSGLAGTRPRRGPHLDGRRRAGRRAGHHGFAVQRRRDGPARGSGEVLVGRRLERQDLERGRMERGLLERQDLERRLLERQDLVLVRLLDQLLGGQDLERQDLERRLLEWSLVERRRVGHGILELIE